MIPFNTPDLNAKIEKFKSDFIGHEQLYQYGQFYVTNRTIDYVLATVEQIIRSDVGFMFSNPQEIENLIQFFRSKLSVRVQEIDLNGINAMISLVEVNRNLEALRALFVQGPQDMAKAQTNFNIVWQSTDIGSAPPWFGILAFSDALAAYQLEKTKCFEVLGSFARKLHKKRGITSLPVNLRLSNGIIAGALPQDSGIGQLRIGYNSPQDLVALYSQFRRIIDAGGFIQCGVLSGALHEQSSFPNPEHYILIFDYGIVDGKPVFLFWDPDAAQSNISTTQWGTGFGCLFALANSFSTGSEEADLVNIDINSKSDDFGNHLNDTRRHRYQVYYIQTLPL